MKTRFRSIDKLVQYEAEQMFGEDETTSSRVVMEADLYDLPEPVQRYMIKSKVPGKPFIQTVRLKQSGRIRMAPGKPWMDLTAEQHYRINPPGFIWKARIRFLPLLSLKGRDKLFHGKGNMLIRLGCITLVNASGPEMDQGSLMRFLSETIWFPSALLSDHIKWEPVDGNSARATLIYENQSVSGIFIFSDEGDMVNFRARRYRDSGKKSVMTDWSTPAVAYGEFNGCSLPVKGSAVWNLEEGEFRYIDVELVELEYDTLL